MTHKKLVEMVEAIGLPWAYDHFAQGESPDPPFLLLLLTESYNFFADGLVYQQGYVVALELYTDVKDPALEKAVEDVLTDYEIAWNKSETWIPSERLYEVRYAFGIAYDASDDTGDEGGNEP